MSDDTMEALEADAVRFRMDPAALPKASTRDCTASSGIVGQKRALEALRSAINMNYRGFNVFVAGSRGVGRFAAVREMIDAAAQCHADRRAFAYVHDFERPERPILVVLKPGDGRRFVKEMEELRETLKEEVPALLASEGLLDMRHRLGEKAQRESAHLLEAFAEKVREAGYTVVLARTPDGTMRLADIQPLVGEQAVPFEQLEADPEEHGLTEDQVRALAEGRDRFRGDATRLLLKQRDILRRYRRLQEEAQRRWIGHALEPLFDDVRRAFGKQDKRIERYLAAARKELLDHLNLFRASEEAEGPAPDALESFLSFLEVNLLTDTGPSEEHPSGCPVVEENHPSFRNLFGTIEISTDGSPPRFDDVRGGSLLEANGGYLLLMARDLVSESGAYDTLKRTLRKGELEIGPGPEGQTPPSFLKPEPIPLDVKVILVGTRGNYSELWHLDPDFRGIFKMLVELDDHIPFEPEAVSGFLSVLRRIVDENELLPFGAASMAAMVEEGVRLAGAHDILTTRFSDIADLAREASFIARGRGAEEVGAEHVQAALDARHARHATAETRILESFSRGHLLVDTRGSEIGQINGLVIYSLESLRFGVPARISATAAVGTHGVVNIEREAQLSGAIHSKGMLILSGLLSSLFAKDRPLSVHANVAFEQSYGGVDGDSASLAEFLALLSALSNVPLRQDVAVTGSLSQRGAVQPVGGVTEKVTGFYHVCAQRGLTGTQGAVIPHQNADELFLEPEIAEAVASGRFHVWPAHHFRQVLHLLTGRAADEVLGLADRTLAGYAESVKHYRT